MDQPPIDVLLAAHGSTKAPASFASVQAHADRLGQNDPIDRVGRVDVGFYRQTPSLGDGFDALDAPNRVVVPMLMSAGYFASQVFPGQLGLSAARFGQVQHVDDRAVVVASPIGADPAMVDVVDQVARDAIGADNARLADTAVVVVGHGTPRHRRSTDTVKAVVDRLAAAGEFGAVANAFVDDHPTIAASLSELDAHHIVVVPYFIADGPHVTDDIPAAVAAACADKTPGGHTKGTIPAHIQITDAVGPRPELTAVIRARIADAIHLLDARPR